MYLQIYVNQTNIIILKVIIKNNSRRSSQNDHNITYLLQLHNITLINNKNSVYINEKQKLITTVKKLTVVVKLQSSSYIFHVHIHRYTIDNGESLEMYYIMFQTIYRVPHGNAK